MTASIVQYSVDTYIIHTYVHTYITVVLSCESQATAKKCPSYLSLLQSITPVLTLTHGSLSFTRMNPGVQPCNLSELRDQIAKTGKKSHQLFYASRRLGSKQGFLTKKLHCLSNMLSLSFSKDCNVMLLLLLNLLTTVQP